MLFIRMAEIQIKCPQTKQAHDFNKGTTASIVRGQLQHSKALISEFADNSFE